MKFKKITIASLLFIFLNHIVVLQKSFATAEELGHFPDLPATQQVEYDKFWTLINELDLKAVLKQGQQLQTTLTNDKYKEIVRVISDLIESKSWSNKTLLREFMLLERDRLYWQEYNWWPPGYQYSNAIKDVKKILSGFENIIRKDPKGDIADEALFRLGLCYSTSGELGLNQFEKAIDIFDSLKSKYPYSKLADDAEYEIINAKIESTVTGGKIHISNEMVIRLLKEFIVNHPESNKVINARSNIAFYYRMTSNYRLAVEEYLTIIRDYPHDKKKVLESLKETAHIYRYNLKNAAKEREILKIMMEKYPDTIDSKFAADRLRDLRLDDASVK